MLVGLSTCGCGVTYQLIVTYPLVVVWNIFLLSILPTWGNDPIFYFRLFSRILFGVLLVYFFECKPHRSTALPQPSRSAETAGASCFGELPVVESEPIASGLLRESTRKLSKFAKCQGKRGWSYDPCLFFFCWFPFRINPKEWSLSTKHRCRCGLLWSREDFLEANLLMSQS